MSQDRNAVLWARVSTDRQAEQGYSLEAQVDQLRDYAAKAGLKIVSEHVVSESASKRERTAFDEMLRRVSGAKGARHLLAAEADRLSRSLASDAKLDELRMNGLSIHLVREGRVLGPTASSAELLLLDARAMVARYESRHHGERVTIGMRRKAQSGLIPGPLPIGYRTTTRSEPAEPDPETAPAIVEMFEACAAGTPLDGLAEIARRRNLRGRRGGTVGRSSIQWLLRSVVYQGDVDWGGETYLGQHEPLVSRSLWSKAQLALDTRRRGGKRTQAAGRNLEFSGLLTCKSCKRALVGEFHERPGGKTYTYYRCGTRCGSYVREEVIRESVAQALEAVRPTKPAADAIRKGVEWGLVEGRQARAGARTRLLSEQGQIERRLDAAYTDCADGRIERERYDRLALQWRADQERVRAELAELDESHERGLRHALDVLEVALRVGAAYRRADRELRREILQVVTRRGTWDFGTLALELTQPIATLTDTSALQGGRPEWWTVLDEARKASPASVEAWNGLLLRLVA